MEDDEENSDFDINSNMDRVFTHYHRGDDLTRYLTRSGFDIIDVKRKIYTKVDERETTDLFIVARFESKSLVTNFSI